MAPNKFASVLNRKTNRITLVLVYALLEWTLIFFLLLNSLLSYLIIKFANYFGLKPPCLLCSRIDHASYRDLICDHHAIELSRSGYCLSHRKLVESQDVCEDCSAVAEDRGVKNSRFFCRCCGEAIKSEFLINRASSVAVEDGTTTTEMKIIDDGEKDGTERSRDIQIGPQSGLKKEDDHSSESFSFWLSKEGYSLVEAEDGEGDVVLEGENEPLLEDEDSCVEEKIIPQHLEFYIDLDDYQLIPVELAYSETERRKVEEGKVDELWRVTDEELVVEPDIRVAPAAFDAAEKLNSSSIDSLELYETKIEDLPAEQGREKEREIDLGDVKIMDPPSEEGQEEEAKGEVGNAVALDEREVEILPAIEGQAAAAPNHMDFHVGGDQQGNVPLSACGEEVAEKRDVMELHANILTSGFGEVCNKESDAIYIVSSIESLDRSQVTEPPTCGKDECPSTNDAICEASTKDVICEVITRDVIYGGSTSSSNAVELSVNILTSDFGDVCKKENDENDIVRNVESIRHCKDEYPSTNDVICEASTSSSDFLEKGDHEPKQTDKTQNHNDMTVEIAEPELQSDAAVSDEPNEVEGDRIPDTPNSAHSLHHLHGERPLLQNIGSTSVETLDGRTGHELDCDEEVPCEASSTSSSDLLENGDYVEPKQIEETQNHRNMIVEIAEPELQCDAEGDRIPDTPNSVCSLHHLHNETPLLQNMGLASAETLDGGEEVATFSELKSLLESERKALRALYAELDEERNAAAVATNQTMAMINRLQEEKATIEMEALQYQRMMEEQSEYDQEALQLLNEMLIKREKELQELEKELEACRKRVMDYEERERMRLLSQRKDRSCARSRTSSVSCSNGEESDEVSVDLNNESRDEDGYCKCEGNGGHQHNTPVDAILDLQDSFCSFEEERISILEQLKVLEEKLCSLSEEEEHHIETMKPFEQFYEENATEFDTNGKHHQERRMNGSKPKQLLPLFDAAEIESDGELSNGVEDGSDHLAAHTPLPTKYELERKRLAIEEEVDHVYDRLHALEADREFVKHCVGSLRKGDKGVHLLQEILQHLRDLKNVELEARNVCGSC